MIMKFSGITARRRIAGVAAGALLGGVAAATIAAPNAAAAPDCTADGVSNTVSTTLGSARAYLEHSPGCQPGRRRGVQPAARSGGRHAARLLHRQSAGVLRPEGHPGADRRHPAPVQCVGATAGAGLGLHRVHGRLVQTHRDPPLRRRCSGGFSLAGLNVYSGPMVSTRTAALAAAIVLVGSAASAATAQADPEPTPPPPAPESPPAPAPPAPGSAPKTTIDADGTYAVGTDIQPGVYSSAGPVGDGACYWKRVNGTEHRRQRACPRSRRSFRSTRPIRPSRRTSASRGS